MSGVADPADEQVSHGEDYHGLGDVEAGLVVADEATVSGQPADAALDYPAPRDHLESRFGVGTAHDLNHEVKEGGLVEQLATVVGAVGEEMFHPRPAFADSVEDRHCSGAVGNIRPSVIPVKRRCVVAP